MKKHLLKSILALAVSAYAQSGVVSANGDVAAGNRKYSGTLSAGSVEAGNTTLDANGVSTSSASADIVTSGSLPVTSNTGFWTRYTTFAPSTAQNHATIEMTVRYESNPKLLTTYQKVFKMWYGCGSVALGYEVTCYAESATAKPGTWVQWATPVISDCTNSGHVVHPAGGPYIFYGPSWCALQGGSPGFNRWESADGVTGWTKTHSTVIGPGTTGAWNDNIPGNIHVVPNANGSTWYALVEWMSSTEIGRWQIGAYSSTDQGITWVPDASNPVMSFSDGSVGGPDAHWVPSASKWYAWTHGSHASTSSASLPTELYRWYSSDFHTWTCDLGCAPSMTRRDFDEGAGNDGGQLADPNFAVNEDGTTDIDIGDGSGPKQYLFYSAANTQGLGPAFSADFAMRIKVGVWPSTMAELVPNMRETPYRTWARSTTCC